MFFRLLAAFIFIPLIELYLLLQLAQATSALTTFAVVIITGFIGSYLARREGVMALTRFQAALGEGRMPSKEIQDGLMIVFAGALLLTPGILTDAFGFTLLVPVGRDLIRRFVLPRMVGNVNVQVFTPNGPVQTDAKPPNPAFPEDDEGYTIDAEAVRR